MSRSVLTVRWNHSMKEAWELMDERGIRHLPVVGEDGKLLGVLSDRDVKRAMDPKYSRFANDCRVGEYMNWPVVTVEQSSTLVNALNIMIEQKISALLVMKSGGVVGIVTSEDLLKVLRELLLQGKEENRTTLSSLPYQPLFQEAMREAGAAGI